MFNYFIYFFIFIFIFIFFFLFFYFFFFFFFFFFILYFFIFYFLFIFYLFFIYFFIYLYFILLINFFIFISGGFELWGSKNLIDTCQTFLPRKYGCMPELTTNVLVVLLVNLLASQIAEFILPKVMKYFTIWWRKKSTSAKELLEYNKLVENKPWEAQSDMVPNLNTFEDYNELGILFFIFYFLFFLFLFFILFLFLFFIFYFLFFYYFLFLLLFIFLFFINFFIFLFLFLFLFFILFIIFIFIFIFFYHFLIFSTSHPIWIFDLVCRFFTSGPYFGISKQLDRIKNRRI